MASTGFAHERIARTHRTTTTLRADYPARSGVLFDLGGGLHITEHLGLGLSLAVIQQTRHVDLFAELPASILQLPFPFPFDPQVELRGATMSDRREVGLHGQVLGTISLTAATLMSVYGGPSYLWVEQELVSRITLPTIAGFGRQMFGAGAQDPFRASALGFNAGVDVVVQVSDRIGVGGGIRLTRAKVELPNALGGVPESVREQVRSDVGGVQVIGGLRVRFP